MLSVSTYKLQRNEQAVVSTIEKRAFGGTGIVLDVPIYMNGAKDNEPPVKASAHATDVSPSQSNFLRLMGMLMGLVHRTLKDMLLRHTEKLRLEIGEFLKRNQSEIRRLQKKKVFTSHDYLFLFQRQQSRVDVHRMNVSILCKLLNLSSIWLSRAEHKGLKDIQNLRRWLINRPKADVSDEDFPEKMQQVQNALSLIKDDFCNKDESSGLPEETILDWKLANVVRRLFDEGSGVVRRTFLHLTNDNPVMVLDTHRSTLERLLEKNTLNKEQWKEVMSPSGNLDITKANFSQLCTLLQTVCGDLPTRLSKCIEKFQKVQMCILHHGSDTLMDTEFYDYRKKLNACIQEIDRECKVPRFKTKHQIPSVNLGPGPCSENGKEEHLYKEELASPPSIEINQQATDTKKKTTEMMLVGSLTFAPEDKDLDGYFAQKARCGGSVPLESTEPVRMPGGLQMIDCNITSSGNFGMETEKRLRNILCSHSVARASYQSHGIRKAGRLIANEVYIPAPLNTKLLIDTSEKVQSSADVGIEYEVVEQIIERVPREIKYLPSNRLPLPQIDMELVVAYVQHNTLDSIFNMMTSPNPPGPQVTMKYELLRLCTYRNFPDGDKPYSIRLAAAGFYFAGEGDELTCYCCGQRKSGWTSADLPVNIHSMLSPGCVFFTKNLDVNVPVPHPPDTRPNRQQIGDVQQENGACGHNAIAATAPAVADVKNNLPSQPHQTTLKNTERRRPTGNMAFQTTSHPLQLNNAIDTNVSTNVNQALSQQAGLGIDFERPKHPQYAVKAVRLQSFDNWPRNVRQTPPELAEAGMYYAGFGDCVRCFFCGIGLRHWSDEDNPWIEHARWAPRCVFLRQVKGDEFVDLVQLAVQYSNEEDEDIPGNPTASNSSPNELVVRQQPPKNNAPNYLLTDAAQSVLEMGYQPRMVQKAIDIVLRQKGREHLTATSIMEHVLELEEMEEAAATAKLQKNMESMNLNTSDSNVNKSIDDDKTKVDTIKILQQNKELKDQTMCKVCLDNPVCIVFLPCGHLVTCAECAPAMRKCPICRAIVKGTVKTYMA